MDERFCYCVCIRSSSVRNSESVYGENSEFYYVFRVFDLPTRAPYHTPPWPRIPSIIHHIAAANYLLIVVSYNHTAAT
jgi:hypothetical protein